MAHQRIVKGRNVINKELVEKLNFADKTFRFDFYDDGTLTDNPKGEQIKENESNNLTLQGTKDSLSRVIQKKSTKNTLNEIAASSPIPPPSPVYDSSETDNSNSTKEKFHEKEKNQEGNTETIRKVKTSHF